MLSEYQYYGLIAATLLFVYYLYKMYQKTNYWKEKGVPSVPSVPVFGNELTPVLGIRCAHINQVMKYNYLKGHKFGGTYLMSTPMFFPRDPSLIEHIVIKDFSYFYNRGLKVNTKVDPLQGHLFNLEDKKWKGLRNKLSPTFTSGKLKTMHQQLIDCANILLDLLNIYSTKGEPIDFKETMAKFTTDVIGACAYGLNTNSLRDPDSKFRIMGRKIFAPTFGRKCMQMLRMILRSIHQELPYLFKIKSMPEDVENFFTNLVKDTIQIRETNNISRNDFIQLLINLRKQDKELETKNKTVANGYINESGNPVELDDNVLAANAFLFFVAGFETTASTLSYTLFELSKNQELQQDLYNEISAVMDNHGGEPTYDAIKEMPLLEMVISETLRKYPPAPTLFRECNQDYKVPDSDFVLPKGSRVEIPIYALQHDPEIFHDPEKYLPERFSPENIDLIPKGAYMPFGDGPRICIGARFAQIEIKVALCKVLSNFKVFKNEAMGDEIIFDPRSLFILMPKGEILLDITPRK